MTGTGVSQLFSELGKPVSCFLEKASLEQESEDGAETADTRRGRDGESILAAS